MIDQTLRRNCNVGMPQVVDDVDPVVDPSEVLRYLGYPADSTPHAGIMETIEHWIREAAARATPRATYVVLPVEDLDRGWLKLQKGDETITFQGAIGEFLGPSQLVTAFIATAGPGVEQLATELMSAHDDLAAMVANGVGAERAEAAEIAVVQRLRSQIEPEGFATTLPYSPGYCGMALVEQKKLFGLFGEETAGVTLTDSCLMRPLKSISGLIGIAPAAQVDAHGSPCDRCELYTCAMRR